MRVIVSFSWLKTVWFRTEISEWKVHYKRRLHISNSPNLLPMHLLWQVTFRGDREYLIYSCYKCITNLLRSEELISAISATTIMPWVRLHMMSYPAGSETDPFFGTSYIEPQMKISKSLSKQFVILSIDYIVKYDIYESDKLPEISYLLILRLIKLKQ